MQILQHMRDHGCCGCMHRPTPLSAHSLVKSDDNMQLQSKEKHQRSECDEQNWD